MADDQDSRNVDALLTARALPPLPPGNADGQVASDSDEAAHVEAAVEDGVQVALSLTDAFPAYHQAAGNNDGMNTTSAGESDAGQAPRSRGLSVSTGRQHSLRSSRSGSSSVYVPPLNLKRFNSEGGTVQANPGSELSSSNVFTLHTDRSVRKSRSYTASPYHHGSRFGASRTSSIGVPSGSDAPAGLSRRSKSDVRPGELPSFVSPCETPRRMQPNGLLRKPSTLDAFAEMVDSRGFARFADGLPEGTRSTAAYFQLFLAAVVGIATCFCSLATRMLSGMVAVCLAFTAMLYLCTRQCKHRGQVLVLQVTLNAFGKLAALALLVQIVMDVRITCEMASLWQHSAATAQLVQQAIALDDSAHMQHQLNELGRLVEDMHTSSVSAAQAHHQQHVMRVQDMGVVTARLDAIASDAQALQTNTLHKSAAARNDASKAPPSSDGVTSSTPAVWSKDDEANVKARLETAQAVLAGVRLYFMQTPIARNFTADVYYDLLSDLALAASKASPCLPADDEVLRSIKAHRTDGQAALNAIQRLDADMYDMVGSNQAGKHAEKHAKKVEQSREKFQRQSETSRARKATYYQDHLQNLESYDETCKQRRGAEIVLVVLCNVTLLWLLVQAYDSHLQLMRLQRKAAS